MAVLTVFLIDIIWRESVGEVAPAASLTGKPVYAEHNTPWSMSVKSPSAKEAMFAIVTAYSSTVGQTDSTPYTTAHQTPVREGIIACPRYIPFHTKIVIQGRTYDCEDRMNIRHKDKFDIWFPTKKLANKWGIKKLEVIIR